MKTNRPFFAMHRQRGAALFVAMIMLILLTLLAVAASQVSLLQERMSGSFRAQNLAFQRSEGAVAEGRDVARDPLQSFDKISDIPVGLVDGNKSPWSDWLDTFKDRAQTGTRACGGACPARKGSAVGEDPARKPKFYVISSQQKDAEATDDSVAAWASVQTIYVY